MAWFRFPFLLSWLPLAFIQRGELSWEDHFLELPLATSWLFRFSDKRLPSTFSVKLEGVKCTTSLDYSSLTRIDRLTKIGEETHCTGSLLIKPGGKSNSSSPRYGLLSRLFSGPIPLFSFNFIMRRVIGDFWPLNGSMELRAGSNPTSQYVLENPLKISLGNYCIFYEKFGKCFGNFVVAA